MRLVMYPDKATGLAGANASDQNSFTYDRMGRTLTKTDQNGTLHTFTYDTMGHMVADTVTTLGSNVDGTVRKIGYTYDDVGRIFQITSYGLDGQDYVPLNQVQRTYNGLGQLTAEYQAVSGEVNTATTPRVQYGYGDLADGARLASMTYPDGRVLSYNYNAGLDDTISRLSSISDPSGTLESYSYLGDGTVVTRSHPQPGIDLTYVKQAGESDGDAGDKYTGLDRFGRVPRTSASLVRESGRVGVGYCLMPNHVHLIVVPVPHIRKIGF